MNDKNVDNIIEVRNMHKWFAGVHALDNINFDLHRGEIHALLGENGAGKSTLIKILSGVYDYDGGDFFFEDRIVPKRNTTEYLKKDIGTIYQELNLCLPLSIAENIFLNNLPRKSVGRLDRKALDINARKILDELGLNISTHITVDLLSTAQRQLVEIGRAISGNARVIIMDEPTSALAPKEIEKLFEIICELKVRGVSIIYVSHKLEEIYRIADRVTVFRDGRKIATEAIGDTNQDMLISMMVGREIKNMYTKISSNIGEIAFEAAHVSNDKLADVSFYVRKGEIVGFAGLMGAGRTELAKAIYGLDRCPKGCINIDGKKVDNLTPWDSSRRGVGFVPEDRKTEGIFGHLSVERNVTTASEKEYAKFGHINRKSEHAEVEKAVRNLDVKASSLQQLVEKLSGGNQQKVIIARWLVKKNLKVLILDEPTRGIDVGAKSEIYAILNKLANEGMAIIVMSSEMVELLSMCDRIYVMHEGRITAELSHDEASQELIMQYAIK